MVACQQWRADPGMQSLQELSVVLPDVGDDAAVAVDDDAGLVDSKPLRQSTVGGQRHALESFLTQPRVGARAEVGGCRVELKDDQKVGLEELTNMGGDVCLERALVDDQRE